MDLTVMTAEEIELYKGGLSDQIDALREQMQEAEIVRASKQALEDAQNALNAAGVGDLVNITPAPAVIGAEGGGE